MKKIRIDWGERSLINKFYMDQSVKVRMDQRKTWSVKTGRVVRRGYCVSPNLFSLYRGLPYEGTSG